LTGAVSPSNHRKGAINLTDIFSGWEPQAPFRFFEEISRIPRPSYREERIADYLVCFAAERGLWHKRDDKNNVYIKKQGSAGSENLPPVILQGHTDMVCEKNKDVTHDFNIDPLKLRVDGDRLRAEGTTLGADNGIGVAYMLAVLDDAAAVHPPLECLFTSMEEVGLLGAARLDPRLIEGRMMINMDSGPEGGLLINSAGGCAVEAAVKAGREKPSPQAVFRCLRISGLLGGHSGVDIDNERANANKLLGRVLAALSRAGLNFTVASVSGGAGANAIPRESEAVLGLEQSQLPEAENIIAKAREEIQKQYAAADPGFRLTVSEAEPPDTVFERLTTERLVRLLNLLPSGRLAMSVVRPDLVTLSVNLGVVNETAGKITLVLSLRSATAAALRLLTADIMELAGLMGADCVSRSGYPAWECNQNSRLFQVMLDTYRELREREAEIQAVHGGLECAVIAELIPDMDIVAIGPDADCIHTPDEWLSLPSFARTYEYILAVLRRLGTADK
jgi:dipeptidase D